MTVLHIVLRRVIPLLWIKLKFVGLEKDEVEFEKFNEIVNEKWQSVVPGFNVRKEIQKLEDADLKTSRFRTFRS